MILERNCRNRTIDLSGPPHVPWVVWDGDGMVWVEMSVGRCVVVWVLGRARW